MVWKIVVVAENSDQLVDAVIVGRHIGIGDRPIIAQAVVPVLADDTAESLAARILTEEHRIYPEALSLVLSGKYRVEGRRVVPHD
jgi:phosphoribosylglycinamide formyltransferase-1